MTFPARVDPAEPLPDEVKLFVAEHGSLLMRAIVNELDRKQQRINALEREREVLRRRLGDSRGLIDA